MNLYSTILDETIKKLEAEIVDAAMENIDAIVKSEFEKNKEKIAEKIVSEILPELEQEVINKIKELVINILKEKRSEIESLVLKTIKENLP